MMMTWYWKRIFPAALWQRAKVNNNFERLRVPFKIYDSIELSFDVDLSIAQQSIEAFIFARFLMVWGRSYGDGIKGETTSSKWKRRIIFLLYVIGPLLQRFGPRRMVFPRVLSLMVNKKSVEKESTLSKL